MVSKQEKKEKILECLEDLIKDQEKFDKFNAALDESKDLTDRCLRELFSAYQQSDSEKLNYFLDFLSGITDDLKIGVDALDSGFVEPLTANYLRGNVLNLLGKISLAQQVCEYQGKSKKKPKTYGLFYN